MLTTLLVLALVVAVLGSISIIGFCLGEGFFFWIVLGGDACKFCVYGIAGLIWAIGETTQ